MIRGFASASANQKSRYLLAALVFFVIVFVIVRMFPPIEPEIETVAPPLTKLSFKSFPQILPPDSFRFAIIADKDKKAKDEQGWTSHFRTGVISRFSDGTYKVEWESQVKINSQFNEAGRGMELSELVNFNGRLLSFDDRTGIVFEIIGSDAVPRYILMDGDGKSGKGYKSEWATIKDGYLYVGSMGKEWSTPQGVSFFSHLIFSLFPTLLLHSILHPVSWSASCLLSTGKVQLNHDSDTHELVST
eukprot:TRINITY_DN1078_c0_g1_i3.p1 TRINITY_DN1078_c0_g1~~TRINITY_DN1078_c0_g1_i3.p1  ORF type:complete len:246 (+),score=50.69 TRINITY_DN1078_c0_g1_i3:53-790(+)